MSSQPSDTDATDSNAQPTVECDQTWECNEAHADPKNVQEPHTVSLWAAQPRFRIVVDRVDGPYVEATVPQSNDYPRSPEFGDSIATSTERLVDGDRWRPLTE